MNLISLLLFLQIAIVLANNRITSKETSSKNKTTPEKLRENLPHNEFGPHQSESKNNKKNPSKASSAWFDPKKALEGIRSDSSSSSHQRSIELNSAPTALEKNLRTYIETNAEATPEQYYTVLHAKDEKGNLKYCRLSPDGERILYVRDESGSLIGTNKLTPILVQYLYKVETAKKPDGTPQYKLLVIPTDEKGKYEIFLTPII